MSVACDIMFYRTRLTWAEVRRDLPSMMSRLS